MEFEYINITIIDGNVMNMYLIINKGNYGTIHADDSTCHGYYITIFFSSPYTFQADFDIYCQIISFGEMVYKGNNYFSTNINYNYYVSPKYKSNNTIVPLREIINENVNVKCYYSNDFLPYSLITISQKYFSSITPLNAPI